MSSKNSFFEAMAGKEDLSELGSITVVPPDSSGEQVQVGFQGYLEPRSWSSYPFIGSALSLYDSGVTPSPASPYSSADMALTGEATFLAPTDVTGYPAHNVQWNPSNSSFGIENLDDPGFMPLPHLPLPFHVQTSFHGHHPYSSNQDTFLPGFPSVIDPGPPTNQRIATSYRTPPGSFGSLSPVVSTPSRSPSSSFASPLSTTPEGEPNPVVYPDHDQLQVTGQERGRRWQGGMPPSTMSSPHEPQHRRLSRSPQSSRDFGTHLDVPSALLGQSPVKLARRHTTAGAMSHPRPSRSVSSHPATNPYDWTGTNVGAVTGGMGGLDISRDVDPPWHNGPTGTLPSPGRGKVASEAIIAACKGRRKRDAKYECSICSQTFTAKHNLINHQKAHKGIRDQVCLLCGNAFTASGTLTRHTKTCKRSMKKDR